MRGFAASLTALLILLAAAAPGFAQGTPTYRSPGFKGRATAPPTAPAPAPTPVTLAEDATFPDVLVDEAGTSHIVWNEGRGDAADVTVYCRLPRAATACDQRVELVPEKTYGEGDGPQFNTDNGGPKIVRLGNQLAILSYRYPTNFDRPGDDDGSGATVGWVSSDGGRTWSYGGVLARRDINGDAVAFGAQDAPRVAMLGASGLCGMCIQRIVGGRYDNTVGDLGAGGPDRNYSPSLGVENGLPVAAFSDLQRRSYIRRWTGTEPFTDERTWTEPVVVPGAEVDIATGPAGLWASTQPEFGGQFFVRQITGTAIGAARAVTESGEDPQFTRLDPMGRSPARVDRRSW